MENKNEKVQFVNKDKVIARQSNMKWLLDYSKTINCKFTLTEMLQITEMLTHYITDGYKPEVLRMVGEADKLILKKFEDA